MSELLSEECFKNLDNFERDFLKKVVKINFFYLNK
jgi:hypothetical protein